MNPAIGRLSKVSDDMAKAAARSVIAIEDKEALTTRADLQVLAESLRHEMSELKTDVIKWNLLAMGFVTALYSGLLTLLRFKP